MDDHKSISDIYIPQTIEDILLNLVFDMYVCSLDSYSSIYLCVV